MTVQDVTGPGRRLKQVMLDEAGLDMFRRRPLVVLSPHFDDACFSLGAFLARRQGGDLVTVFTQGDYFAHRAFSPSREWVFAVRNGEDAAFAAHCGLRRHDLHCEEPSLRGRRPSQLEFLADDLAQIVSPLMAKLRELASRFAPGERGILLAPMGIGRHVNHRAVHQMVLRCRQSLALCYEIFFYEELPYASSGLSRLAALKRLGTERATRHALPVFWREKKHLVEFYPSRLHGEARPGDFWPRALTPWAPHEAFWSIQPAAGEA
jgi:LmbE family N-acetylglucosaminyl deacetylase